MMEESEIQNKNAATKKKFQKKKKVRVKPGSPTLKDIRKHNLVECIFASREEIPIILPEYDYDIISDIAFQIVNIIEDSLPGVMDIRYSSNRDGIIIVGTVKAAARWVNGIKQLTEKKIANYLISSSNYIYLDDLINSIDCIM